jgi:hypothetical protein
MDVHLSVCCVHDLFDYSVGHSFEIYSLSAGLLRLPDQVVITAVLYIINMYLNYVPVAASLSILYNPCLFPPPAPAPIPHNTEFTVFYSTFITQFLRVCGVIGYCVMGCAGTSSCQFSQSSIINFKTDERNALEAGLISSNNTADKIGS